MQADYSFHQGVDPAHGGEGCEICYLYERGMRLNCATVYMNACNMQYTSLSYDLELMEIYGA